MHATHSNDVAARPFPLAIDPRKTAVIVVDMQQGFFGAGGAWDRATVDVSGAQAIVAPTARVLAAARQVGVTVVYLTMNFEGPRPDMRQWTDERSSSWIAAVGRANPAPHSRELPAGVKDSDILTELAPQPDDVIVVKSRHSGFYNTNLHGILTELGITTLVFAGCTTSIYLESTLRDAYFRDYDCLALADCTAEPIGNRLPRTNREATLLLIELVHGWVAESAALVHALTGKPTATSVAVRSQVSVTSSSTRSPVFSSVMTVASAIGLAFSTSGTSRRRSTSEKPFGASGRATTSVKCWAGLRAIRSASAAQP